MLSKENNLSQRNITIVDYDPNWNNIFASEKESLIKAMGDNALKIEHIGSTSVKGLAAKPIIDILVEVNSLDDLKLSTKEIRALGYLIK